VNGSVYTGKEGDWMDCARKGRSTLWTSRWRLIDDPLWRRGRYVFSARKTYGESGWEDKESGKINPAEHSQVEGKAPSGSGLGCYIGRVHFHPATCY